MPTAETPLSIPVEGGAVSALRTGPADSLVYVYAPGAGSSLADPFGAFLAPRLAEAGIGCLRFQFPYMEAKRGGSDRPARLEATWRAAIEAVRQADRAVAGGRSMGGRIATQVVAQGVRVDGLALFAYPLHPPGKPEQRRDAHLALIDAPLLFCSGTRDSFASPAELGDLAAGLPRSRLHLLDGADHGFAIPRATGRRREDVWEEALVALLAFLAEV